MTYRDSRLARKARGRVSGTRKAMLQTGGRRQFTRICTVGGVLPGHPLAGLITAVAAGQIPAADGGLKAHAAVAPRAGGQNLFHRARCVRRAAGHPRPSREGRLISAKAPAAAEQIALFCGVQPNSIDRLVDMQIVSSLRLLSSGCQGFL